MIEYLIDTNVFSKVFKGDPAVTRYTANLEAAIDTTIYIECLQGSKSNQEKRTIRKVLDNYLIFSITPRISELAVELIDDYSNSHVLLLADALIASNALENDLTLITYNVGDFNFIKDLKWVKPNI